MVPGQWEEGLEQGHGQCVTADGAAYDGQWEAGVRYARCCLQPNLALALAYAIAHAFALAYVPARALAPAQLVLKANQDLSPQALHDIMSVAHVEQIQLSAHVGSPSCMPCFI